MTRQAQRKLSFKDKHALETLPARMSKLQVEIRAIEAALADHSLFAREPKAFRAKAERLAAARREFSEAEELWLELEMKREELERVSDPP